MKLLILGASGGVGRAATSMALDRGMAVRAQTRDAARIASRPGVEAFEADPTDARRLAEALAGARAVLFALGVDVAGPTTLFSDATRALIGAMDATGVRRLVAVTGLGAGDTRGHGGWLYDRVVFPLFTRNRYIDKDRQEALLRASGLDWTILRPAAFAAKPGPAPLEFHATVAPGLVLRSVTREETAATTLDAIEKGLWLREAVFFGRP